MARDINIDIEGKNYIHLLDEDEKCCGDDGDICVVEYGEHNPRDIENIEKWYEALGKAIEQFES